MVAVVNDTVGTMMTCAYEEPTCEVGLIVGGCPGRSLSSGQGRPGFPLLWGLEPAALPSMGTVYPGETEYLSVLSPYRLQSLILHQDYRALQGALAPQHLPR